jgi:hypothetical protein
MYAIQISGAINSESLLGRYVVKHSSWIYLYCNLSLCSISSEIPSFHQIYQGKATKGTGGSGYRDKVCSSSMEVWSWERHLCTEGLVGSPWRLFS